MGRKKTKERTYSRKIKEDSNNIKLTTKHKINKTTNKKYMHVYLQYSITFFSFSL